MSLGHHIIVDVYDIENNELIKTVDGLYELMNNIIEELKLNVENYLFHNFKPYGCSMLYLLSESHLAVHTYYEHYAFSLDLYTCNLETDLNEVCHIIHKYFDGKCKIKKNILNR